MKLSWWKALSIGLEIKRAIDAWPDIRMVGLIAGDIARALKINDHGLISQVVKAVQDKKITVREIVKIVELICVNNGIDFDKQGVDL